MELIHAHPYGPHTVLVLMPTPQHPPHLFRELHARMAPLGGAGQRWPDAVCGAHIPADYPHRQPAPAGVFAAPIDALDLRQGYHRIAQQALKAWRHWLEHTAGTPAAHTLHTLIGDGDINDDQILLQAMETFCRQPRIQALSAMPPFPHAHDQYTELFGIGVQALQHGPATYIDYVASTVLFGHALLDLDGRLHVPGPQPPVLHTVAQRLAHTRHAASLLAAAPPDTMVVTLHAELQAPQRDRGARPRCARGAQPLPDLCIRHQPHR